MPELSLQRGLRRLDPGKITLCDPHAAPVVGQPEVAAREHRKVEVAVCKIGIGIVDRLVTQRPRLVEEGRDDDAVVVF